MDIQIHDNSGTNAEPISPWFLRWTQDQEKLLQNPELTVDSNKLKNALTIEDVTITDSFKRIGGAVTSRVPNLCCQTSRIVANEVPS